MMPSIDLLCFRCKNRTEGFSCKAFPDGIPMSILEDSETHREPIEGDNGIQFEPIEDAN